MPSEARKLAKKFRGIKFNHCGTIDCEVEHEVYGWIPFTADPDDELEHAREIYQELIEGKHGKIEPYIETKAMEQERIEREQQEIATAKGSVQVREALPLFLEVQAGRRSMSEFQAKMDEIDVRFDEKFNTKK